MRKFVPYSMLYTSIFYLEIVEHGRPSFDRIPSNQFGNYLNNSQIVLFDQAGPPAVALLPCYATRHSTAAPLAIFHPPFAPWGCPLLEPHLNLPL
jgi:hypothetical protein